MSTSDVGILAGALVLRACWRGTSSGDDLPRITCAND